jgi:hypothetical protein
MVSIWVEVMRRRLHIVALLPALLAATMWARSYWRFDFGVARGWELGSELGSLLVVDGSGSEGVEDLRRVNVHVELGDPTAAHGPNVSEWDADRSAACF